ncbi:MAG: hypothetical protein ACI85N_001836 [Gammaproteobacteria bacterium]|jgi:hypothetical protein
MQRSKQIILALTIVTLMQSAFAQDTASSKKEYSPYVNRDYPQNVYWGDSHVHTSYSWDAGLVGNTLGPDKAYRFAKGERVISSHNIPAKLVRPLDWLVVADHAESMGVSVLIERSDPAIMASDIGKATHDFYKAGKIYEAFAHWGLNAIVKGNDPLKDPKLTQTVWGEIVDYAEEHNDPGKFTAFIGYEWSSAPQGNNLHRVLIMRGNGEQAKQVLPFSAYDSDDPEDLWTWMEQYTQKTGDEIFAIAHNGNISNGVMFALENQKGDAIDSQYAERRIKWEPLYEATQMKGDGESHPLLSPDDEFADYENWDRGNWAGEKKTPEMLAHEYARGGLKLGLQLEKELGVNPFKFGLIGASDTHTSLASTREDNFFGKVSPMEPSADRFKGEIVPDPGKVGTATYDFETIASGLQGVWSRENTRESLFDAMRNKETYATTGTRISVRVFGGWDYTESDVYSPDFVHLGYDKGVPMGGDLKVASAGQIPRLMVQSLRDPDGANLDRVQIIKGWLDANGKTQERIYDVACSDERAIKANRCEGPVGSTVDVKTATYNNSIGDAVLSAYWQDPEFDATQHAFYYVRVLEIPTPRWTTYDAAHFNVDLPEGVPATQQDRAYTTPIWYTP